MITLVIVQCWLTINSLSTKALISPHLSNFPLTAGYLVRYIPGVPVLCCKHYLSLLVNLNSYLEWNLELFQADSLVIGSSLTTPCSSPLIPFPSYQVQLLILQMTKVGQNSFSNSLQSTVSLVHSFLLRTHRSHAWPLQFFFNILTSCHFYPKMLYWGI